MELGDIEILTNNFPPKNMQGIRKDLLDALKCRNIELFELIVKKNSNTLSVNEIITYVGSDEKDTYLDIACRENLKEFVEFLLDNGAEINRVNDEYDCAPIHFAVEGGYVDILKILLRPSRDVTHREAEQQIDPNLEVEQRTALHIAVEKNYEDCAALLLKKGASANILNSKNQTALHVAARKGQLDMVMLILDNCTERLKVDRYKDYEHKTTRQVIVKKWPYMENKLLKRIPIEDENLEKDLTVQDLKYHLNNRDKESFRDHMKIIQEQIPPHIAQTLLTVSVQHNFRQAVTAILGKFRTRLLNMTKALYMSIQKGHYDIFEELLKAGPQLTKSQSEDLILKICQEMGIPKEEEVDNTNLLKCLELMLKQKNADVCRPDKKGNTPLHYAARADNRKAMSLLLEQGSYIGQKNKFNVPPIMNIPVSTLRDHFNDCLKKTDQMMKDQMTKEQVNKYVIEFDYSCLKPPKNLAEQNAIHPSGATRETEVFLLIAENKNLKHLLKHPLLSSFLYLKWLKIRHILYANFVFYLTFYLLLNVYILCTTYSSGNPPHGNGTVNNCVDTGNTPLIHCCPEIFLWIFVIVLWSLFTVREIFQCACSPYRYVKDWENWLQVLLIIFILIFLCGAGLWSGIMVIILSALELITLIGQHPKMSASFEMFRTVSLTYIRLLFPYTFLIIAFALAFYALFRGDNKKFPDVGHSLFKTSIMITGEFNSSEIPFDSYPVCSRIVFILFVFLIAIVLFNLLNGLAVSDTSEIRSKGELIGLISRIRMIVYLEDIAFGEPFSWFGNSCLSQWNPFGFLINRILLFPYCLKDEFLYATYRIHKCFDRSLVNQTVSATYYSNSFSLNYTKMVKLVRQSAYGGNLRIEEAFQQIEEIQESDEENHEIKDCTNDSKIQDHLLNVYDDICGLSSINQDDFYKLLKCALRFNNFYYFEKAIYYGKQHAVFNANYVYPNGTEETLLDKASRNGQTNFVKLLLKEGAKVNRINKMHNRAPIHFATEGGHANTLAALLKEPTINPNLQVGSHQTALHIAVRRNDPVCTCLLLKNYASPDIPNSKGLTALHLAALRNNREIVKLILEKRRNRYLNIDTYKDYKNQTTREVIQQKLPDILLPPKCKSQEISVYNLKYYLIANDESSFLKRIEFVNILHPNDGEELLEIAVQHNFYKTVIEILKILKKKQFSVRKAAEEAVLQSHSAILQELLRVEPEIANDLVFSVCQQLGIPDERRKDNNAARLKCVQLVLEQKDVDVRRTDSKGNTPLHYVARAGYTEAIILLLHRGSYVGHMNKFDVSPIADIPACTLTNYFNELVDVREIRKEKMNEMIKFDYRFLTPHDVQKKHDENHQTTREMEVIQYIASNKDLKHLLKHPVLSSFLYLKWHNIKDILFLYFFFSVIYYTLLVVYLSIPANENKTQIINNNFNIIRKNYQQISCIFLRIFISLLLLPFISWETFQFISRPWHYLRNVKNLLLNNTLIVLTVVLICGVNHYIVNTILILLSFWKLIILNNQYKDMFISFERNIEFQMTSMTSIKYSVYLLYVISISTSFQAVYVLFTLFEINANFFNSRNHIMIVLLFFFFILLFNVLNASKINTAKNLKKAELTRFISWIDVIAHIENMTVDRYYFCCGKSRWNPFNSLLCKTIFLFPHNLKNDIYIQH